MEIDDYNSEFFFEQEDNWETYQDLFYDEDEGLTPQEKDSSYNIFTLEQALIAIKDMSKTVSSLGCAAEEAAKKIEEFITLYTEYMNGEE